MLTKELREVMEKIEQLKDDDQKAIAKLLEEELQWNKTFQSSQSQLSNLANEALKEYRHGKTSEKDW
jgi:hypothetical protein